MAKKKKCITAFKKTWVDSLLGRDTLILIDNENGIKIINKFEYDQYFKDNAAETKSLYDERDTLNKNVHDDATLSELRARTNLFFQKAIRLGIPNLDKDILKGFDVYRAIPDTKIPVIGMPIWHTTHAEGVLDLLKKYRNGEEVFGLLNAGNPNGFQKMLDGDGLKNLAQKDGKKISLTKKDETILKDMVSTAGGLDRYAVGFQKFTNLFGNAMAYIGIQAIVAPAYYGVLFATQRLHLFTLGLTTEKGVGFSGAGDFLEKHGVGESANDIFLGERGANIYYLQDVYRNTVGKYMSFPDIYNTVDSLALNLYKNYSGNILLKQDGKYSRFADMGELSAYFDNLKIYKPAAYKKELGEFTEKYNTIFQSVLLQHGEGASVLSGNKFIKVSKQVASTFLLFLSSRGVGTMKEAGKVMRESNLNGMINGNTRADYVSIVENFGTVAGRDYVQEVYTKNYAMLKLLETAKIAAYNGIRSERIDRANGGTERGFIDYVEHGLAFSSIGQAMSSIPWMRATVTSIGNMIAIAESENGNPTEKAKLAAAMAFSTFVKESAKRYQSLRALTAGAGQLYAGGDAEMAAEKVISTLYSISSAFKFFGKEQTLGNSDIKLGRSGTSMLLQAIGIEDSELGEFFNLKSDILIDKILSLPSVYINNYLKYNIKGVSDWNIGGFAEGNPLAEISAIAKTDEKVMNFDLGFADISEYEGLGAYAYGLLTDLDKYDSKNKKQERGNEFNAIFKSNAGNILPKQWKEDFVTAEVLNSGGGINMDKFREKFFRTEDSAGKYLVQIEKALSTNRPGSAKLVVGYLLGEMFDHELKKVYSNKNSPLIGLKGKEWIRETNYIREDLGNKYGDLLYTTDKNSRLDLKLAYIKESHPEVSKYIDYKGYGKTNIMFPRIKGEPDSIDATAGTIFALDTFANISLANGNINGDALRNNFATILQKKGVDFKNAGYGVELFSGMLKIVDSIDGLQGSKQEKNTMKQSLLVTTNMYGKRLEATSNVPEELIKRMKKPLEDFNALVFGTWTESKDIKEHIDNLKKEDDNLTKSLKGKTKTGKDYVKDYTSKNNSGTYSNYVNSDYSYVSKMNSNTYSIFKDMIKTFKLTKTYAKTNYTYNTYSKKERDYLTALGDSRSKLYQKFRNFGQKSSGGGKPFVEHATRASNQKGGFAVPPRLREMPRIYKDTDWTVQGTIKETRRRSAVKYDPGRARSSVIKGQISRPAIMPVIKVGGNSVT